MGIEMRCLRAISRRSGPALAGLLAAAAITFGGQGFGSGGARADDLQADSDFAKRFFAANAGAPKAYACFIRRYDAAHMAQHPQQKVTVMKLLVTSEKMEDDKYLTYSFRLGVNFRDQPGDFDSSGDCGHAPPVRNADTDPMPPAGIDFQCDVDCDGGGIAVNLANGDNSLIVKLGRIRIWKSTDPDGDPLRSLEGGADDKVFRLDRTSLDECRSLVADRKELAALRHKK
jgi:hypothetical protein